jgi:hypothetical protein
MISDAMPPLMTGPTGKALQPASTAMLPDTEATAPGYRKRQREDVDVDDLKTVLLDLWT